MTEYENLYLLDYSYYLYYRHSLTDWRFSRKSANVEQFYAVVGILEEYEEFLMLAQKLAPAFFAGAPRSGGNLRKLESYDYQNKNLNLKISLKSYI